VDLKKLEFALRLEPVAKYEDGTWGAKISAIVNGLPWDDKDEFPPKEVLYFLMIKGEEAEIIKSKKAK